MMKDLKREPAAPPAAKLHRAPRPLLRAAMIFAAYLCAFIILDLITKQLEELPGVVTWYPPAGLTYALLLVFGVSFAPAVTIVLLISSVFVYHMPQPPFLLFLWAFIISLIYTATAAFLRRRIHFDWRLKKLRDVVWLVVTTVLVSALLAVLSVSSSALSSDMPRSEIPRAIFEWWIGETVGVLTITPFLLIYVMPWLKRFAEGQPNKLPGRRSLPRPTLSDIGQAASIVFVLYWVFGARVMDEFHPLYLLILPLIWIALGRGFKGVSAAILALNSGMVLALWLFRFDLARLGELELLMIVNCIIGLLVGAVVTERQQADKNLLESELKFRTVFNQALDGILIADMETRRFFMGNSAVCRMLGYSHDELPAIGVDDIHPPEQLPYVIEQFNRQARGEIDLAKDIPVKRQDGSVFYAEINSTPVSLSGHNYILGVFRDITERKRAEQEIEALSRFPSENPNPILRVVQDGKIIYANTASDALLRMWDSTVGGYLPPGWRERAAHAASSGAQTDVDIECGERVYSIMVVPVPDTGYVNLYGRDVTERKRAGEELRQSEARFRILFEQAGDVILQLEITPEGIPVIREANSATLRVLGYERDELIGRPVSFLEGAPDADKVIDARWQNILSGTGTVFEVKHRCKDGTLRVFESSVAEMKVGPKNYAILVERDTTERTRSVDRIRRQLEHLTAMSAIDRVIAANFNLMLTLSEILTHVTTELGMDAADILLLNSTSNVLDFCAEHGFRTKAARNEKNHLGESYAGRAALERHLVQVPNLRDEPEKGSLAERWRGEEFVCYYGVPLISKGQVKGVLEVFHRTALEPDAEWFDFLNALAGQTAIAIENSTLFESLQHSNIELALAYDATIEGWSHALDLRDKETEGHTQRVTEMTVKIARVFGLSEEELAQARWGALLHDIGKMGVPDGILLKPGPLTDEEWVAMKKHPTFAFEMLAPIGYLRLALDIPYCHHEKWDGTGYPRGLKGAQIPLIARIFAVVDVWDALRSDRPYRAAWTKEKVREHIRTLSGTDFDPKVVDIFLQNPDSFEASSIPG
jgi:PAS domain S-box-containing protein/putative nucleotidyltransferase with HDIG domain